MSFFVSISADSGVIFSNKLESFQNAANQQWQFVGNHRFSTFFAARTLIHCTWTDFVQSVEWNVKSEFVECGAGIDIFSLQFPNLLNLTHFNRIFVWLVGLDLLATATKFKQFNHIATKYGTNWMLPQSKHTRKHPLCGSAQSKNRKIWSEFDFDGKLIYFEMYY